MSGDACLTRVTGHLLEVADLLEALGENPHRIRAYRNAVTVLMANGDRFQSFISHNTFDRLPGIGRELAAKITVLAGGGEPPGRAELEMRVPPQIGELTRVDGVDRKTAIYLAARLHIESVAQLRQLADTHMLRTIPWLAPERERRIRRALAKLAGGTLP